MPPAHISSLSSTIRRLVYTKVSAMIVLKRSISMARSANYLVGLCVLLMATGALGVAQELKRFPGAQLDEKASREASQAAPGKESQVYTTSEGFDTDYTF